MNRFDKRWINFYDKTAQNRENVREFWPVKIVGESGNKAWITTVKSKLRNKMKLLDVGCGTGRHLREINKVTSKKVTMIGIDISPGMIRVAKTKSRGIKNLKFLTMDAYKTKFKNNYFDIVINRLGTRSHDEVFRILKKGGYYLLFVTDRSDWKEMVNLLGFKKPYDIKLHKKELRKSGFKVIQIKKYSSIEYYKDVYSLAKMLSIIPFNPTFSKKKHMNKLKKYVKKHTTRLGIKSSQKRIIIICRK
jgi:ubiquinone/menaquinone biosynthesis C-methylase UbiE